MENKKLKEKFAQKQITWWRRGLLYVVSLRKCKLSKNWTKFIDTVSRFNFTKIFTFYCCHECMIKSMILFIYWKLNNEDKISNAQFFLQDAKFKTLYMNCLSIESMKIYSPNSTKWIKVATRILIKIETSYKNNFVMLGNSKNNRDKTILEGNFFSVLEPNLRKTILDILDLPENQDYFSVKDFYDKIKIQPEKNIFKICRIIDNTKEF